jgi:hypothetical protein
MGVLAIQAVPFQTSARVSDTFEALSNDPTATQSVGSLHETLLMKKLMAPVGGDGMAAVHVDPFHCAVYPLVV